MLHKRKGMRVVTAELVPVTTAIHLQAMITQGYLASPAPPIPQRIKPY
jgi:hypothetical protein